MVVLIVVSMAYLTVKDELSLFLLRHANFFALYVDFHHYLIGPLGLIYVGGCRDRHGDVEVVGILLVYYTSGYISKMVFYCFLPESWSKVLSY